MRILEPLDFTPECEANWRALLGLALEESNYQVAEQCCSVLGDVSKARYLRKCNKMAIEHYRSTGQDGT